MPKIVTPLTDTKIKTTKANPEKVQKFSDGNGLFLIISKTGDKNWRFDYSRPYTKKRNSLSFGSYPTVTILVNKHAGMALPRFCSYNFRRGFGVSN